MANPNDGIPLQLKVEGLDCPREVEIVRKALEGLPGVSNLSFTLNRSRMSLRYQPEQARIEEILSRIRQTGMKPSLIRREAQPETIQETMRGLCILTVPAGGSLVIAEVLHFLGVAGGWVHILYSFSIVLGLWFFSPKAWKAIRSLRPDMNVLMTIAIFGAVALGEWAEAATIAFLLSLAELLEAYSLRRAYQTIENLMTLSPETARVIRNGSDEEVPVEAVEVDDRVLVRPGERIPLDGEVVKGHSFVNESPITGESLPTAKTVGNPLYAGTLNQDGALEFRVTKPASESTLSKVTALVEEARARRTPTETFVNAFAKYYTPAVIALAVALAVVPPLAGGAWTEWIYRALVLLMIACPCAFVVATPISMVCALATAARNGVLVKGGAYLEAVGKTRAVALDKTGTLTTGRPRVANIIALDGRTEMDLLRIASAVERQSEHPLAQAVCAYAEQAGIAAANAEQFIRLPGRGVSAVVEGKPYWIGNSRLLIETGIPLQSHSFQDDKTSVGIATAEGLIGSLVFADTVRSEAERSVRQMREQGIDPVVMLTGDHQGSARRVADEVGIREVYRDLLPEDKVKIIEQLVAEKEHVVMVGDGVNDAPALAVASVGIAMGAIGTDVALETADIALLSDDLEKIPWLIRHSRRTVNIIRWNIFLALSNKLGFVAMAIPGLATLWMAVLADTGASLLVIFNGMRLLRSRP